MTDKKPTTAEIMAMLRKKPAEGSAPPAAEATPAEVPAVASEATPAPAPAPAPAADKPKSSADIMAAIRAKAGAAPAAPAPAAAAPAAAAPAAKPKSSADIMAAIRAKGAAQAAAASPAAPSPAADPPKPAAAPAAAGKSAADMIKAMRESAAKSEVPVTESTPAAAAKPKFPPKPTAPAAAKKAEELPRRSFAGALFEALCTPYYFAWTMLSAIGAIGGLGIARFMMPNTVLELPSKFKIGSPGDFPLGAVSEKYKASRGVWIVHTDGYDGQNVIYALSSVCTHLGCTPSWLDAEQKYKCPCHGSGFYITGINFEGPAPRPLERVGLSLGPDGLLEVDKSLKFQEELGQWSDQKSFVKVG